MSALEAHAVQSLIAKAEAVSVDIPADIHHLARGLGCHGAWPAVEWARLHPDAPEVAWCCDGAAVYGIERCTCWEPEYHIEQQPPQPPRSADDLAAQARMCGDCAFRKDSPERADEWMEEALIELTQSADTPFWCHQGMRRPARWRHPDGRVVDGSPDDWRPPMVNGVPFRADGSPGLLCFGWATRAAKQRERRVGS